MVKGLWKQVNDVIEDVLKSKTLQDLVENTKREGILDYRI
jgi:DNA-binding IscR family transcriptional regulator